MDALSTLRKHATTKTGKFRPGAQSRIAELLNCSRATVRNVFFGDWRFSEERMETISKINWTEFPLYPKKSGRPRKNKSCQ